MSQMNIVRVSALPAELAANTTYLLALSATELQVVVVGNTADQVRKTIIGTDVDGKLSVLSTAIAADLLALEGRSQADATAKANAAEAAAIAAAALDATSKANAAQAAAIAAAATDATNKADAAQAAAISAAAADATSKSNQALVNSKAYTDAKVAQEIGNLDLSGVVLYAADIAERDLLEMTKNSLVLVADATADATVDAGAAMYFYNVADDSWLKIAEYESLDLIIPNKQILTDLSDVGGQLYYKGAPIATVHAGTSQW